MGIYLVRMRNYFKAEADAVEFLQNRASFWKRRFLTCFRMCSQEQEIQECTALGMTLQSRTKMTQSLAITRENIADDYGVVAVLRGEAELMRDDIRLQSELASSRLHCPLTSSLTRHGIDKYIASMSESGTGAGALGNGSAAPLDFSGTTVTPVHAHGMNGNTNANMPVPMIKFPSPPKKNCWLGQQCWKCRVKSSAVASLFWTFKERSGFFSKYHPAQTKMYE
eukprot:scaffold59034_cov42-Attheya_sp.AAC.2